MTPKELRAMGESLYGPHWQSPLSREIGVWPQTIRRWLHTGYIPKSRERQLRLIAESKGVGFRHDWNAIFMRHAYLGSGNPITVITKDFNDLAAAVCGQLIKRSLSHSDVAVYALKDGAHAIIGDAFGRPWLVEV